MAIDRSSGQLKIFNFH